MRKSQRVSKRKRERKRERKCMCIFVRVCVHDGAFVRLSDRDRKMELR